ncbi:hypothetical protein JOQ06_019964 [Pogonophryne albipinna]|uniref:F-box/WD repeat-containing protein 7 n=1 Tax=Pogonophryne albipinna TaxID=1090488 RepID=A0AAD6BNB0_9TELE|nr:hypothetical protein JOQ06_019964 [Pogonophryne albipinna]
MSVAMVISGSTDRTLRVWDAESGECVHTLYGHTSTVRCMHLHGDRVVSGSRDTTLRVWCVSTGRCVCVLTGHVAAVRCVQFDGRRVVSGGYDYMVKVAVCTPSLVTSPSPVGWSSGKTSWFLGTPTPRSECGTSGAESPNKHQSAVTCLQFCRGLVLSSSDDGTVKLWDLKTGSWVRDVVTLQSRGAGGVVWRIRASDTRLVCAAGSRNGTEETKLLVLDFDLDDRTKEEE